MPRIAPSTTAPVWVQRLAYPVILFGGLACVFALQNAGLSVVWSLGLPLPLGILAIAWLERRYPYGGPGWRAPAATMFADLVHTALTGVFPTLFKTLSFAALYAASSAMSKAVGASLWPQSWPLLLQLLLALCLGELGAYALHRLCHRFAALWRIHALHHSTERLYFLASGRNHPLNALGTSMLTLIPLVLLGAGDEVLLLHTGFTALQGFWQHTDLATRSGWLNYFLASPELHRWHHSRVEAEGQCNFGNNLIIWDLVFGTWFLPADRHPPVETGIEEMDFGRNVLAHLASPFRWQPLLREPIMEPTQADRETVALGSGV